MVAKSQMNVDAIQAEFPGAIASSDDTGAPYPSEGTLGTERAECSDVSDARMGCTLAMCLTDYVLQTAAICAFW